MKACNPRKARPPSRGFSPVDSPHAQAVKVELPLGRTTLTAENGEYNGESAMGGGHNTTTLGYRIPPFPLRSFLGHT
jgi:hypothetical protein